MYFYQWFAKNLSVKKSENFRFAIDHSTWYKEEFDVLIIKDLK